jgi:hypothetical protein
MPAPRPAPGVRPGQLPNRPGNGGIGGIGNRPGGGAPGPIRPNPGTPVGRPGGRPGVGDIGGAIGRNPIGHLPGTPGNRPGIGYYHKSEMTVNIHNHFRVDPRYGVPLSRSWCNHWHPGWRYNNWPYWTAAATGVAIGRWLGVPYGGYGSSQPIEYYPVEPAPQGVYDQNIPYVSEVAQAGEDTQIPDDAQWQNIGTYGLIPMGHSDMAFGLQLASLADGTVRGMQWDMATNATTVMGGSIDKETLRVAWQATGAPDSLYFESTIDQLTQQESLINVYNPQTKALQSWQVIQINESDLPTGN